MEWQQRRQRIFGGIVVVALAAAVICGWLHVLRSALRTFFSGTYEGPLHRGGRKKDKQRHGGKGACRNRRGLVVPGDYAKPFWPRYFVVAAAEKEEAGLPIEAEPGVQGARVDEGIRLGDLPLQTETEAAQAAEQSLVPSP